MRIICYSQIIAYVREHRDLKCNRLPYALLKIYELINLNKNLVNKAHVTLRLRSVQAPRKYIMLLIMDYPVDDL